MSARWIGVADAGKLHEAAFERIVAAARLAIESRGRFAIVLAGGNTPRAVYAMLRKANTDWARWEVYFGDERCIPRGDPERNDRMAAEALLDHVPIPRSRIHAIPAELGALEGALAYRETLREAGVFDLVLLGLGEDGHTASLFPGHDLGVEPGAPDALPVIGAPKPPPQRVTLSAARLGRARAVLFLVEGEAKRDAVRRWRNADDIPARAIRPEAGCDVLATSGLLR